jgi:hypothetical protein
MPHPSFSFPPHLKIHYSLPPSLPLADRVAKLKRNGESKQKNVRKTEQNCSFFS